MKYIWQLAHGKSINLAEKAILMGILNVTPDSFSDGGLCNNSIENALKIATKMVNQGADIIDIGGESTRPNANPVDSTTEQARVLPVLQKLSRELDVPLSVDTYRFSTARLAIEAGAHIINDIYGLQKEPEIANIVAQTGAGIVIMHTGRERKKFLDTYFDQKYFFTHSLAIARKAKIERNQIVLDPGFGFSKTVKENITLMQRAKELGRFGFPLLAGTSRKHFVGIISGKQKALERDLATGVTSNILRMAGFNIFRVHNVALNKAMLSVVDAIFTRE